MGSPHNFEFLFNLLYSVPATINIILPFCGGFILDRHGARNCLIVYILLVATGHCLYTVGLSLKLWPLLFAGRAVFGLGDGSTSVANLTILASWFEGKELALALGLNLSASRFGSVFNNLISPAIANSSTVLGVNGVVMSIMVAVMFAFASVAAALLIFALDRRAEAEIDGNKSAHKVRPVEYGALSNHDIQLEEQGGIHLSDVLKFSTAYKLLTVYCLLIYGKPHFYPCPVSVCDTPLQVP